MIKKLQRKFIIVAMSSAFAVMVSIMFALNFAYIHQTNNEIRDTLDTLAENNGRFPEIFKVTDHGIFRDNSFSEETPFKTRFFVVQTDNNSNIIYISLDNVASVTKQEALSLGYSAMKSHQTYGGQGIYRYIVSEKYYGKLIIFVDCREQVETRSFLLISSMFLVTLVMMLLFIPVYYYSRKATRPVAESFRKQKQFITDAGHEIKTPIAIISANADVLEMCGEDNEWVQSIKNQTKRLDKLVKNLIALSRMDENDSKIEHQTFSLSDAVLDTAAPFNTLAMSGNKNFSLDIQPDISYTGDEASIREVVSILCDNAIKYSDDGGEIKVSLSKKSKSIILDVYNTCESIDVEKLDKLFDRFYRVDDSRSRQTGGFGIGLSMAKAVVLAHKGKITAKSADGHSVNFTVVL